MYPLLFLMAVALFAVLAGAAAVAVKSRGKSDCYVGRKKFKLRFS